MLERDFNNGKGLNLSTSLAIFTIIMGFLFLLDAAPGIHMAAAGLLILFGFVWYFSDHIYHWWQHQHHH